ncbi:MAG: hypothetical protein IT384_32150 [Deltaproteobacteria bacterium]|nr:hypothetical protein [Deltaproteobacteria bacterium]
MKTVHSRRLLSVLGAILIGGASAVAGALAGAVAGASILPLSIGDGRAEIEQALRADRYQEVEWIAADAPQALRRGLIATGLLETLNRFGLAPKDAGGRLDAGAFTVVVRAQRSGRRLTLALSGSKVRAMLLSLAVPVDASADPPGGWSPARLAPLRRALDELSPYRLEPLEKDARGNVFAWKGRRGGEEVRALYLPERDELRVLVIRGG